MQNFAKFLRYLLLLAFTFNLIKAQGYTVSELTATCKSGQVFFTWKNPAASNLQYNLYRCTIPILTALQITPDAFVGYVRDNSAKNIRKSELKNSDFYFVITDGQAALASDRGLYVSTCTAGGNFYYAVTVTDLNTGIEDKTILPGFNALLLFVSESIAKPKPVLQAVTTQPNGDISNEYVVWGDNHSSSQWPAFNNAGSYGYNFTLQEHGVTSGQPLFVQFCDQSPFKKVDASFCSDCNVLQPDDWLPNGENTYWVGYNNSYNMYTPNGQNPIVTSGFVYSFTQARLREILKWARLQSDIDSTRVYMSGKSHNGFGCMITALNNPSAVACIYPVVTPIMYRTKSGNKREHLFCKANSNIPSDVLYPGTTDSILIWD